MFAPAAREPDGQVRLLARGPEPVERGALGSRAGFMQEPSYRLGGSLAELSGREQRRRALLPGWVGDGLVLPRCYQNSPYQDDLGRQGARLDRFGLFGLGRLEYPEYVARGNS